MKRTQADKWFSIYIRLKYADENGIVKCYTCGEPHHWKKLDAGHAFKRNNMGGRYNEDNTRPQCRSCNWLKQGNDSVFYPKLEKEIGKDKFALLQSTVRTATKYTQLELDILTKEFKEKAKKLAKEKGLKI